MEKESIFLLAQQIESNIQLLNLVEISRMYFVATNQKADLHLASKHTLQYVLCDVHLNKMLIRGEPSTCKQEEVATDAYP